MQHFVNVKNGIEVVPDLRRFCEVDHYSFLRIQSTLCERGDVEKVMSELDSNFMMHLSLGSPCVVYDLGSRDVKRDGLPRAFWYGLEFITYCLTKE